MLSIEILETIGRKLIEHNGIYDYNIKVVDEIGSSGVVGQQNSEYKIVGHCDFVFGHSSWYGDFDEVIAIINEKYPISKTVNPFIFVVLHEIGHAFDFENPAYKRERMPREMFRELPREKAADMFAANFIWENPKMCEHLSKMADNAVAEFWSGR